MPAVLIPRIKQKIKEALKKNPQLRWLVCYLRRFVSTLRGRGRWDLVRAGTYLDLGHTLCQQGQMEEALKCYLQVLSLKPDWQEARFSLGNTLCQSQDYQGAITSWQQLIALKPDWIEGYGHIADRLILQGKLDEAMNFYQQGLDKQRLLAEAHQLDELGIRFLKARWTERIGHIALLDFYVKMGLLGWRHSSHSVLLAPQHQIANLCFLNYWSPYIGLITESSVVESFSSVARYLEDDFIAVSLPNGQAMWGAHAAAAVQNQWEAEGRPPLLSLAHSDHERGWRCLQELGVPKDTWFVCLHVREPGFYGEGTTSHQAYRDADISTYLLAIQSIVERGGWVIRMGDPTMKPLAHMAQVIDYAHSDIRSDWMDVFLCAQCHFFIGVTSGLHIVPSCFGVPCALTNYVPMAAPPWYSQDIYIPKLYWSVADKCYLTFAKAMSPPLGYNHSSDPLTKSGVVVVDNTPEEINDLVIEMLERLEGSREYTQEDKQLQERFKALAATYKSYESSRIGRAFIQKYSWLLPSSVNEQVDAHKMLENALNTESGIKEGVHFDWQPLEIKSDF